MRDRDSLIESAVAGDVDAMRKLGNIYANGDGIDTDYEEACHWYKKCAEAGDADSMHKLANLYANGQGVEQDKEEADKWYKKAAQAGYKGGNRSFRNPVDRKQQADDNRADHKEQTEDDRADRREQAEADHADRKEQAENDRREEAEKNQNEVDKQPAEPDEELDAESMRKLGNKYADGDGVEQDLEEAARWYKKAAEAGDTDAMRSLGDLYENGKGVKQDKNEAARWYNMAEKTENPDAAANTEQPDAEENTEQDGNDFVIYYKPADGASNEEIENSMEELGIKDKATIVRRGTKEEIAYNTMVAGQGDADAMFSLAESYEKGQGIAQDYKQAFSWYQKAAEAGHADAMNRIGILYWNGLGAAQDYKEAVFWFKKAAEAGNATGMSNLAFSYKNGFGTEQDYSKALQWFQKAAQAGDVLGIYFLGEFYQFGYGVEQDYKKAFEWYRKAAEAGHADAMNQIGWLYHNGYGVEQDYKKAFEWHQKAAEAGSTAGKYNIGWLYENGYGVEQNYHKAFEWYQKAAEAGHANAMYQIGWLYHNGYGVRQDYQKAYEWYRKASEAGNTDAMNRLGVLYTEGHGVKQDFMQANFWFEKAVEAGNADAMNNLGYCYEHGRGVEQDYRKAIELYRKSAEAGNANAMNNLGYSYLKGHGVEVNYEKAYEWSRRAAEAGSLMGMDNLGNCYEHGCGVEQDKKKAFELYQKAADAGDILAMFYLGGCYLNGTGTKQNNMQAYRWYSKAARKDSPLAVSALGDMYREGRGVRKNYSKAEEYYKRADQLAPGNKAAAEGLRKLREMQQSAGEMKEEEKAPSAAAEKPAASGLHAAEEDSAEGRSEEEEKLSDETQSSGDDPMEELNHLVGLTSVKAEVQKLKKRLVFEKYRREKMGIELSQGLDNYNYVFIGNPGTGKTTVARLLGSIYHELGLLDQGQLIEVDRSSLVSEYQGQTAKLTRAAIQDALGGVLFVDEAYALLSSNSDSFGKEAVDTLVKGIEDNRGKMMVILAGYRKEMKELLNSNSGLESRFKRIIEFPDFTEDELLQIAKNILAEQKYHFTPEAELIFKRVIAKKKTSERFGNARTVRNILSDVISEKAMRFNPELHDAEFLTTIEPGDFGAEYNVSPEDNIKKYQKELDDLVGLAEVKKEVKEILAVTMYQRESEESGQAHPGSMPMGMNMFFLGNPGTGKTTVARLYGKLLNAMGILKSGQLIEVTRSDLVGQWQGHTAEKTRRKCEEAYGGILFIDEAYSLCNGSGDNFGNEAINELIKQMEDHRDKLVVIMAGYTKEMNEFIQSNSGIASRINRKITFPDYSNEELFAIAEKMLEKKMMHPADEAASEKLKTVISHIYEKRDANFGNAREMRNLTENIFKQMAVRVVGNQISGEEMHQFIAGDVEKAEAEN